MPTLGSSEGQSRGWLRARRDRRGGPLGAPGSGLNESRLLRVLRSAEYVPFPSVSRGHHWCRDVHAPLVARQRTLRLLGRRSTGPRPAGRNRPRIQQPAIGDARSPQVEARLWAQHPPATARRGEPLTVMGRRLPALRAGRGPDAVRLASKAPRRDDGA